MPVEIRWIEVLPGVGRQTNYKVGDILEVEVLDNEGRVRTVKDRLRWRVDNKWFRFVDPPEVSCI
jgi:hypothetical protein